LETRFELAFTGKKYAFLLRIPTPVEKDILYQSKEYQRYSEVSIIMNTSVSIYPNYLMVQAKTI
jgi:hypothetical protein